MEIKSKIITLLLLLSASVANAQPWVFRFTKRGIEQQTAIEGATNAAVAYRCVSLTDSQQEGEPFRFSIEVPDGNYRITLVLGSKKRASETSVLAESARLMLLNCTTEKGEQLCHSFVVNKRSPRLTEEESCKLKEKVAKKRNWDNELSLDFYGTPAIEELRIEPVECTTIFLFGDSTVCDYDEEPYASWGQILPLYCGEEVAVANYAESGETASSCMGSRRFNKGLSQLKNGDYVFIELGHNDQKQQGAGKGAYYSFTYELKKMIDQVVAKGGKPVLLTPLQRRRWSEGKIVETHRDYPEAVRAIAAREQIPVIDLTTLTTELIVSFGEEASKQLYVHLPANTLPNQPKALKDNSHFSTRGAYEVARCVVGEIDKLLPELASRLNNKGDITLFQFPTRVGSTYSKPDGN